MFVITSRWYCSYYRPVFWSLFEFFFENETETEILLPCCPHIPDWSAGSFAASQCILTGHASPPAWKPGRMPWVATYQGCHFWMAPCPRCPPHSLGDQTPALCSRHWPIPATGLHLWGTLILKIVEYIFQGTAKIWQAQWRLINAEQKYWLHLVNTGFVHFLYAFAHISHAS
eukprot:c22893_g1_i1 orf=937-1452(+)